MTANLIAGVVLVVLAYLGGLGGIWIATFKSPGRTGREHNAENWIMYRKMSIAAAIFCIPLAIFVEIYIANR